MFESKRIAVVIPAYNEELLLRRAIDQVPTFVDDIIVVDDGSRDSTGQVVAGVSSERKIQYIWHEINRGVGGAIVSGYRRALDLQADVVAVMAGDAQMDPEDLPRLLEPAVRDKADYVKGDRLSWPGVATCMPIGRFVGNHVLSVLTRISSGYLDVRDSQCGYSAITRQALLSIDLDKLYGRYGFPNDLLAHLHAAHARLAQVPVRPIYGVEKSGISLYTACVRVPLVLLRSFGFRLQYERHLKLNGAKRLPVIAGDE